uniref:probable RNA 2'-phosphotransferase n=1 Tax=Styela clava TaxID=7725 RepID=UPI001939AE7E|nr:probable RNA 2'-phosphotransferase [Styela clava]
MAVDDEDPGVWPVAVETLPGQKLKGNDEISRFIVYHLRHKICEHGQRGIHPWTDIQYIVWKQFGEWLPQRKLQEILEKGGRVTMSDEGVGAVCGHSKGENPEYERYEGNEPLYHMTQKNKIMSILTNGLKKKQRRFIHLTNDPKKIRGKRTERLKIWPTEDLGIVKTPNSKIFLAPDTIPVDRIKLLTHKHPIACNKQ